MVWYTLFHLKYGGQDTTIPPINTIQCPSIFTADLHLMAGSRTRLKAITTLMIILEALWSLCLKSVGHTLNVTECISYLNTWGFLRKMSAIVFTFDTRHAKMKPRWDRLWPQNYYTRHFEYFSDITWYAKTEWSLDLFVLCRGHCFNN